MHNFKEFRGKFIVAIVTPKKNCSKTNIKGVEETLNVINGIPDGPLENLIHSILGKNTPVLPIHISA